MEVEGGINFQRAGNSVGMGGGIELAAPGVNVRELEQRERGVKGLC